MKDSLGLIRTSIFLYFVIAFEVLIMISPFAGFFYAAFDPVLLFLAKWPATSWLSGFFLPHMVMPPGAFLKGLRIAGSVLFVGGALTFLVCAGQVYYHKFFTRTPALGGLYRWIRHPQYLALEATGLGLSILWPRFLTLVLWVLMVGLYALLARDEERRMVGHFGRQYAEYMENTGAFAPRWLERVASYVLLPSWPKLRPAASFLVTAAFVIGGAFALRSGTVSELPLWTQGRVAALSILTDDHPMLEHRMGGVLGLPAVQSRLAAVDGRVLVYLMPPRYVMQGMIADTGPEWRLFQHHGSLAMIFDWIFHPFRHLEGGHMMMHHQPGGEPAGPPPAATLRRLIFLKVDARGAAGDPTADFALGARRTPLFFTDVDMHSLDLKRIQALGPGTGWGEVPTPMF